MGRRQLEPALACCRGRGAKVPLKAVKAVGPARRRRRGARGAGVGWPESVGAQSGNSGTVLVTALDARVLKAE